MARPLPFNTYCVTDSLQVRSENLSKYSWTYFRARARASSDGEVSTVAISPGGAWAEQVAPVAADAATSTTAHHHFRRAVTREHSDAGKRIRLICGAFLQTGIRT